MTKVYPVSLPNPDQIQIQLYSCQVFTLYGWLQAQTLTWLQAAASRLAAVFFSLFTRCVCAVCVQCVCGVRAGVQGTFSVCACLRVRARACVDCGVVASLRAGGGLVESRSALGSRRLGAVGR